MKTTGTHTISGIARVASIGAIASAISITTAFAQHHGDYNFERRMDKQQNHVQEGIQSGQLTRFEVNQLKQQNQNIAAQMKSDRLANGGKLTSAERHQVLRAQNREARKIYRLKHDQDKPALSTAPVALQAAPAPLRRPRSPVSAAPAPPQQ